MISKINYIPFILLIAACNDPPPTLIEREQYWNINNEVIQSLHYHKDTKTGLCFADLHLKYYSAIMTNVPCTKEVEEAIRDKK